MAKKTALDKAIEEFDRQIAVLQAAKAAVIAQQAKAPKRRPKPVLAAERPA